MDIPPIVAGFLIFGLLTVYTALSGEVGGLLSQAFQGFVMVLAGLVLIIAFFVVTGGFGNVLEAVSAVPEVTGSNGVTKTLGATLLDAWGTMPGGISLTWMLIPILGCVGQPQVLTRMYAVKNPRDLPKAGLVTAVTHTIVGFLAVVAAYGALYLVATGTIDPLVSGDQAIYAFSDYLGIWAQVLVYAAILAAALSSASMFLTSSSTLISKDLTSALGIKIAPEKQINVSRVFMFVLGAVSIVVSIYSTEMVALLGTFGWGTLVSGTFPVFVLGLLWERCNEKGVMCGVAVSLVFNIIPFFGFKFPSALPGYFITSALAVARYGGGFHHRPQKGTLSPAGRSAEAVITWGRTRPSVRRSVAPKGRAGTSRILPKKKTAFPFRRAAMPPGSPPAYRVRSVGPAAPHRPFRRRRPRPLLVAGRRHGADAANHRRSADGPVWAPVPAGTSQNRLEEPI